MEDVAGGADAEDFELLEQPAEEVEMAAELTLEVEMEMEQEEKKR